MAKDELIDDHVATKQLTRAVDALLDHAKKTQEKEAESDLLGGKEQHVWLQVAVKKMHAEKKLKPHKIPIKYPLVDPRTTPVCLITKDPQREYKDLLESHGIKFINRVVGITKLKGKFKPFEARRLLLQENGLFLADERVVPLLPGLLGKAFFKAKKQPIPVCLTRKDLKGELERAISSTYMHQNQGTCTSVKVGTVSMTPAQVLANLKTALPAIVKTLKGEWDNVQSLSIKTNSSVSLPIWSCDLGADEGARWDGLVAEDETDEEGTAEDSDEDKEMQVDEVAQKPAEASKGKKRSAEEQEQEKPKKKVKAASAPTAATPATTSKSAPPPPTPQTKDSIPAPAPADAGSQKKRRKSKGGEPVPSQAEAAIHSATAQSQPSSATPPSTSVSKASKKQRAAEDVPSGPMQTAVASGSEADVESSDPTLSAPALKKKEKRRKSKGGAEPSDNTVVASAPAPAPAAVPAAAATETGEPVSKKRKAKASAVDGESANTDGKKKGKKTVDAAAPAPEAATKAKKRKDAAPAAEPPTVPKLSADELKQKRSAEAGEKKKEKIVKGKKGSAKEALVGKKM